MHGTRLVMTSRLAGRLRSMRYSLFAIRYSLFAAARYSLFATAWSLLGSLAAAAASPEDDYFAARDRYVEKFSALNTAGNLDEEVIEDHQRARDDLGRLLRPIVGPVAVKGFLPEARTNLDSLFKGDLGFGLLDGLLYSSRDDKTHLTVTTSALFDHWLNEHRDWWGPKVANVPQEPTAALKSEAFYTQALTTDSAFVKFAELPVAKPATATFAFAMLSERTQDRATKPDEVIVAIVQGRRILVISAPAGVEIATMPACEHMRAESDRKLAAMRDAVSGGKNKAGKDDDLSTRPERLEQEGDAAFYRCFAERAKSQAFYAKLTRRAQGLVDLVARR
jgi:hypothetical protein